MLSDELLNVVLAQVRYMIDHPDRFPWSFQGLGMYRVKLSDSVRVHIWMPSHAVPGVEKSAMHTHPWTFRSMVLAGRLTDYRFRDTDIDAGDVADGRRMIRHKITCGIGEVDDGEPTTLRFLRGKELIPCQDYYLPSDVVHYSAPHLDGTVTVLLKLGGAGNKEASVYRDPGVEFVSADQCTPSRGAILTAADYARRRWYETYGVGTA